MNSNISQGITPKVSDIVSPFYRLLAVGETKRGGLILCKPYYAEFAGPGAAIACPTEPGYSSIIAIGDPEFVEVITPNDRQRAYSRRIQWVRWLQKIVFQPDQVQRAEKLISGFEEFFSGEVVSRIPDEILALLVGVFPETISTVRSQNRFFGVKGHFSDESYSPNGSTVGVVILDGKTLQPIKLRSHVQYERSTHLEILTERSSLPQSA